MGFDQDVKLPGRRMTQVDVFSFKRLFVLASDEDEETHHRLARQTSSAKARKVMSITAEQ